MLFFKRIYFVICVSSSTEALPLHKINVSHFVEQPDFVSDGNAFVNNSDFCVTRVNPADKIEFSNKSQ